MDPIWHWDSFKDVEDGIIDWDQFVDRLCLAIDKTFDIYEELAEKHSIALDQNDRCFVLAGEQALQCTNNGEALIYWIMQIFEGIGPMIREGSREIILETLSFQLNVIIERDKLRSPAAARRKLLSQYPASTLLV